MRGLIENYKFFSNFLKANFWLKKNDNISNFLAISSNPNADPGVVSSISAHSLTFVEIDHEMKFYLHSPPADSRRVVVSYK